jgi:hypothetical protein
MTIAAQRGRGTRLTIDLPVPPSTGEVALARAAG